MELCGVQLKHCACWDYAFYNKDVVTIHKFIIGINDIRFL